MIYLGVDPGKHGAIALLDAASGELAIHDMPDTTAALHELIVSFPVIQMALLERPFYPHAIGATNVAKIAEAYGTLKGALQWLDIPAREVAPAEWKKRLALSSSKSASREKASMLFPASADLFRRVKDDGRAEAALIAWLAAEWRK